MLTCMSCRAETSNGLALCALCIRKAELALDLLPIYFRNLTRWRPGRAGSRAVPGSREPSLGASPRGDRVFRALDDASNDLVTWVRELVNGRPTVASIHPTEPIFGDLTYADEHEQVRLICWGFARHLTSIATLDWCGDFVHALARHEATLRILTEDVAPGWYAGGCKTCDAGVYVVPGLTWVTCNGCGATTAARDHAEVILTEAAEWVATPKRLAETLVALLDTEQSVESLRKRIAIWGERGFIPVHQADRYAIRRYRLADVVREIERRTFAPKHGRIGA